MRVNPSPSGSDRKTEALAEIIVERVERPVGRLLVVGCGAGAEAATLAMALGAPVVGIDLHAAFDPQAARVADLRQGDATRLAFADASFDFVFSYHVLEHIADGAAALSEMRRVLAKGGSYCIGTPNRLRMLGYLGSKDARLRDKLAWNLADWKARLSGRFRNELGAHAGFSSAELGVLLARAFGSAEDVTVAYYGRVYQRHAALTRWLGASGLGRVVFPSIYFMGQK